MAHFSSKIADFSETLNEFERRTREMASNLVHQASIGETAEFARLTEIGEDTVLQVASLASSETDNPVDTERSQIDFSELPSALSMESLVSRQVEQYEQRELASRSIKEAFRLGKGVKALQLRWWQSGIPEVIRIQRAYRAHLALRKKKKAVMGRFLERMQARAT